MEQVNLYNNRETQLPTSTQAPISTTAIRTVGAIIVVIASIVFLFQGAGAAGIENSTSRHWIFLGITALFGGLTWFLGAIIKENKGARTTIALAVSTIPVLFTQLGAMLYDILGRPDEGLAQGVIDAVTMDPVSKPTFVIIAVATALITLPIAYLGNRILARKQMNPLTILLMTGNALILLPVRSNLFILSAILIAATAGLLMYVVKTYKNDKTMKTKEGLIALVNLFIPVIIIAFRTLTLYEAGHNSIFIGLLLTIAGVVATILPLNFRNSQAGIVSQSIGAVLVACGWFVALIDLDIITVINLKFYLQTLPLGALMFGASFLLKKEQAILMRRIALVLFVMVLLIGQVINLDTVLENPIPALITLLGSLGLITAAVQLKEKTPMILSAITLISSVLGLGAIVITSLSVSYSWILLMIAGIAVIIAGSLTEVFNKQWKGKILQFKDDVSRWQ